MIGWSANFGELEKGDPELHHVVGSMFAEGNTSILSDAAAGD